MRSTPSYFTVNVPYSLPREVRKERNEILRTKGYRYNTQARNTKDQADALAQEIEQKLGFAMEVNESCDLFL